MTTSHLTDAEQLSDRGLDALVHQRVMGLQCKMGCPSIIAENSPPNFWRPKDDYLELDEDGSFKNITYVPGGVGRRPIPEYSKSIAAAFTVEDRIAELNLRGRYVDALITVVGGVYSSLFPFVHATARQRCLAALAAIQERK